VPRSEAVSSGSIFLRPDQDTGYERGLLDANSENRANNKQPNHVKSHLTRAQVRSESELLLRRFYVGDEKFRGSVDFPMFDRL